jgi:hypothetical protein
MRAHLLALREQVSAYWSLLKHTIDPGEDCPFNSEDYARAAAIIARASKQVTGGI